MTACNFGDRGPPRARSGLRATMTNLCGLAMVVAEQTAEPLAAPDRTVTVVGGGGGVDEAVAQPLVISFFVVMRDVFVKKASQVSLAERDHAIEALAADGADEALGVGKSLAVGRVEAEFGEEEYSSFNGWAMSALQVATDLAKEEE